MKRYICKTPYRNVITLKNNLCKFFDKVAVRRYVRGGIRVDLVNGTVGSVDLSRFNGGMVGDTFTIAAFVGIVEGSFEENSCEESPMANQLKLSSDRIDQTGHFRHLLITTTAAVAVAVAAAAPAPAAAAPTAQQHKQQH
uniref:Uncharacterized protein n=1 Tax=Glossina austeni TaxID=7395 RepID=A0A1A9UL29_GLOAU